jgi:hypothetical protein
MTAIGHDDQGQKKLVPSDNGLPKGARKAIQNFDIELMETV